MPLRSHKGRQKSVLDLGATQGVAYSRKVDFQSGYPRYHRLTKIHCPPGRYIETCSNDAKRRVHRNLHMNSGPLPEATPCVQTWSAKVHVYSCVFQLINRQLYKQLNKNLTPTFQIVWQCVRYRWLIKKVYACHYLTFTCGGSPGNFFWLMNN